MDENRLAKLEAILKLIQESVTREEFITAIEKVTEVVQGVKADLYDRAEALTEAFNLAKQDLDTKGSQSVETTRTALLSSIEAAIADLSNRVDEKIASIRDGLDGKDGQDGKDGKDADETVIIQNVIQQRAAIVDGPDEIRDKLELLQGDERLDKSAIKGLPELEEELKIVAARPISRGHSPVGVRLYVDGSKKGLAQYINLIAGTGIQLSYNASSGRNDITITATGTASLSPITVTGTIDDSNTSFTAASTPNLVIVNGAAYRDGKGCTISGTSITLDNPVGTGGDIYCL